MELQRGVWVCQSCDRPTIRPLSEEEIPTCGQRENLYCPLCEGTQTFQFREMLRDLAHERWVAHRQAQCERIRADSSGSLAPHLPMQQKPSVGYYNPLPQIAGAAPSWATVPLVGLGGSSSDRVYAAQVQNPPLSPFPSTTAPSPPPLPQGTLSYPYDVNTPITFGEEVVAGAVGAGKVEVSVQGAVVSPLCGAPVGSLPSPPPHYTAHNAFPLYATEQVIDSFLSEQCPTDESLSRLRDYITNVVISRIDKMRFDRSLCLVCMERPKSVICLPCKHRCLCRECLDTIQRSVNTPKDCPMCRTPITDTIVPFE